MSSSTLHLEYIDLKAIRDADKQALDDFGAIFNKFKIVQSLYDKNEEIILVKNFDLDGNVIFDNSADVELWNNRHNVVAQFILAIGITNDDYTDIISKPLGKQSLINKGILQYNTYLKKLQESESALESKKQEVIFALQNENQITF